MNESRYAMPTFQANANGHILRSEIVGAIKMRVYLSGMPELRLGLNDKVLFESTGRGKSKSVELEDVKFHQCVRLSRQDIRISIVEFGIQHESCHILGHF